MEDGPYLGLIQAAGFGDMEIIARRALSPEELQEIAHCPGRDFEHYSIIIPNTKSTSNNRRSFLAEQEFVKVAEVGEVAPGEMTVVRLDRDHLCGKPEIMSSPVISTTTVQSSRLSSVFPKKNPTPHSNGLLRDSDRAWAMESLG